MHHLRVVLYAYTEPFGAPLFLGGTCLFEKILCFLAVLLSAAHFVLVYFFIGLSLSLWGIGWLVRWPFQTLSKLCDKVVNLIGKGIGPQ